MLINFLKVNGGRLATNGLANGLTVLVFLAALSTLVGAQDPVLVAGQALDTNGAFVVGTNIELRNLASNATSIAIADRTGQFKFPNIGTGTYRLTATAEGFEIYSAVIEIDQNREISVVLSPASLSEFVAVSSAAIAGTSAALETIAGSYHLLGREELENSRALNFSDALRRIPGINTRDEEGFGLRPNISIRGTSPTRSVKVLLLEDGLPLSYAPYGDNASYYHPPLERFEAIEVLKGSGQIEYGPVTVAGVVNYLTPNPTVGPAITLKLVGGNRSIFDGSLGYSNTFGKTGLVVNATRKQGAGARENVRSGLSDISSKFVREINDKNVLIGKFSWYGEDSNLTYSGLTEDEFAAGPRSNPFRNDFFYANRFGTSISHTAVFTPDLSATTNFYVNNFSRHWWRQSSNSDERPNAVGRDLDCRGMQDLITTCGNIGRLRNYWVVGIEPRLSARFTTGALRNNLSVGFRYQYEDQNRIQKNGEIPTARDGIVVENNERKVNAIAGFVQNRFIWNNFSLNPGVRIENVHYKRTDRLAAGGRVAGKTSLTQVIPGIGAAYNLFGRATIFAGIHRGFAPPAVADILSNNGSAVDLDSELSWNFEVGVRMRPSRGVRFEGTYFRMDYENQIVPQSVAGGIGSTITNGGETLHRGFELFTRLDSAEMFRMARNIYFQSNFTYLQTAEFRGTRYSSIRGFTDTSVSENRLPYAPKGLLTSLVGYAYKNYDGFIEVNYIGRQFSDDLNRVDPISNGQAGAIPGQLYLNATANYKVERLKSTFFVTARNIADRIFIVDRSRGILPGGPRMIQFGWKLRLGN